MTWRITDVHACRETGQFVFVFEHGDRWVSVDMIVRWYVEKRECHLLCVVVDWVKTGDRQVEREIERFVRENEEIIFDAALAAHAEAA